MFPYKSRNFRKTNLKKGSYAPVVMMEVRDIHNGKRQTIRNNLATWLETNGWTNRSFVDVRNPHMHYFVFVLNLEEKTFNVMRKTVHGTYVHPRLLEKLIVSFRGGIAGSKFNV